MARIFISHAVVDRPQVRRLLEALRRAGHAPWGLEDEVLVGFSEVFDRKLAQTDVVVVCLSRAALASSWVKSEMARVERWKRDRRLIPVRFERVEPPAVLLEMQFIDLFPKDIAWDEGIRSLLSSIQAIEQAGAQPVPLRMPGNLPPAPEVLVNRALDAGLTLYRPLPGPGQEALQKAHRLARGREINSAAFAEALLEAMSTAERGGQPSNAARAALLLGAFEGRRGAWEAARRHLEQALRFSRQAAEQALIAESYRLLGDASLHGSRYEDARLSYAEAIRRFDELGFSLKAARTRMLLLAMLLQLGRNPERDALAAALRQALSDGLFAQPEEKAEVEQVLALFEAARDHVPPGNEGDHS